MSLLQRARCLLGVLAVLCSGISLAAETYYVDALNGDDHSVGTSRPQAWRSLKRANQAKLKAGDRLLLAAGQRHVGRLFYENLNGTKQFPITLGSYGRTEDDQGARALLDGRNAPAALELLNCRHIVVTDLVVTADGGAPSGAMRCGIKVEADALGEFSGLTIQRVHVKSVSFENPGHVRPAEDVRTANGEGRYGWGIRFIVAPNSDAVMRDVVVRDCRIERVDHTGLKFTAPADGITDVVVENVSLSHTGGPGVQLSGVTRGRFAYLSVDHSGSASDSRFWGRGSGLWTWGAKDIVIERSRFTDAHGPGDSAGVHIDFNCENVVVQYCFSARNAGGFCEILGNNFNCAYRYNVSVDDGHRVKGRAGAFQEGKIFWLSGYVGAKQPPRGPTNSYFYNNTIYVSSEIAAKFAVAPTAEGVLVANNIFCVVGQSQKVAGDQWMKDNFAARPIRRAVMTNNLFLRADNWPAGLGLEDAAPLLGDPGFAAPGGEHVADYRPTNAALVKNRGIPISPLPGDKIGLKLGLRATADILGQPIDGPPDLGAIELQ